MARDPLPPLQADWLDVNGLRLYHRLDTSAGADAPTIVYLHGFGISGAYLEPTAIKLLDRARTFIPDLPGAHGLNHTHPDSADVLFDRGF